MWNRLKIGINKPLFDTLIFFDQNIIVKTDEINKAKKAIIFLFIELLFLVSVKFGKLYNYLIILIKQLSPSVKRIILNSNINERNVFREVAEKYG